MSLSSVGRLRVTQYDLCAGSFKTNPGPFEDDRFGRLRASVGTEVELHESVSEKSDSLLLAQERRKSGGRKKAYVHLA